MSTNSIIWMGDIEPTMKEKDIMNFFNKFNIKPQSIKFIKDRRTNQNKNYCFIYFKTIKEANTVLFYLNGKKIPGTPYSFRLNWANTRSSINKSAYVGNLNPKVDDIKLYNLFKKKYPTVQHASVVTENGISKGYGFVLFNGKEEYEKSLKEMNGINFCGNIIKVREQKKKNNDKNKNNENSLDNEDYYSSSMNNSEINYDGNENDINLYENININNNINNSYIFKNSLFNLASLRNRNNSQIFKNNNIINNSVNACVNNIINNQTNNLAINTPFTNINNNNNNNISFSYNIANDKYLFSSINNDINNNDIRKLSDISNKSIVSLNSFNNESMSNYSTAEKFNNKKKHKKEKDVLEILEPLDDSALFNKIQESIKKIFYYYKENPFHGDKKINCKFYYITFLLFIVSKMFLYYLSAVPLEN